MFFKFDKQIKNEIKIFLVERLYPDRLKKKQAKFKFKLLCEKFIVNPDDSNELLYKFSRLLLKIYTEEETRFKIDKIQQIHSESGHLGRYRLCNFLKNKIYGVKRSEINSVLKKCKTCISKALLLTKLQ
ncbi:hypothetical protein H311_00545 [Anncaliia algerae PRA109]|nr:hypothetical protein H311_00545 [Anncaliia algerae PRA109]